MPVRSAAKAIILRDGKVLLNCCRTEAGEVYYDLPGGGQKAYEPMEETVVREVAEETGYDAVVEALNTGTFKTVLGESGFDDKGDVKLPGYVFYEWKDGTYDYLEQ